jgi:broad specificity phosphatase PhoE
MPLKLYLLRHGQTFCSRDGVFCGSGFNPELTSEGQEMAAAFADTYSSLPWQAVYSSPQNRAKATAQPICQAVGKEAILRDGLKEIGYGQWEGKTVETVDHDFHDDYLRWKSDPAWNPPTDGETALDLARRAMPVIEEIQQKHDDGNVLAVAHKATIRTIICALMGMDVGRFRQRLGCPVGSVSVIEFTPQGPLLQTLANCSHLEERLRSLPGS